MPKLAKFRHRHAKKAGEPKRNPPLGTDIVEYILPGFGAFAATRFLTRVATIQIAKRWPKHAKHAGAMASAGAFAAAWFGAHRVKYLEKYHHPIVVGAGLAAIQSLVQLYLPSVGWMVSDCSPELPAAKAAAAKAMAASTVPLLSSTPVSAPPIPEGFTQTDANTWYSYNDSFDAGSYRGTTKSPPPAPMVSTAPDDQQIDELLGGDDDSIDVGLS